LTWPFRWRDIGVPEAIASPALEGAQALAGKATPLSVEQRGCHRPDGVG